MVLLYVSGHPQIGGKEALGEIFSCQWFEWGLFATTLFYAGCRDRFRRNVEKGILENVHFFDCQKKPACVTLVFSQNRQEDSSFLLFSHVSGERTFLATSPTRTSSPMIFLVRVGRPFRRNLLKTAFDDDRLP